MTLSKLEEIERALDALNPYVENGEIDEGDYNDAVQVFRRALTLVRELRENAVEGFACPRQSSALATWVYHSRYYPQDVPCLLILSEPNP